jgi:hypothetical protein
MSVVIDGDAGCGKTALLTWILGTSNVEVFANYDLGFDHKTIDIEIMFKDSENSRIFGIDEAQSFVDCRKSMSGLNILFSYATAQRRKTMTVIAMTVPDINMLELRSRQMCDVYINAQRIRNKFIYEINNLRANKTIHKTVKIEDFGPVFALYKTHSVILNSNELKELKIYNIKSNETSFDEEVELGVDKCWEYAMLKGREKITHATVKLVMMRAHISKIPELEEAIYLETNERLESCDAGEE